MARARAGAGGAGGRRLPALLLPRLANACAPAACGAGHLLPSCARCLLPSMPPECVPCTSDGVRRLRITLIALTLGSLCCTSPGMRRYARRPRGGARPGIRHGQPAAACKGGLAHARGAARLPRPRPCAASVPGMHGGRGPVGRRPSSCRAQMSSPDRREPRPGSARGARAVAADGHNGTNVKPPRRIRPPRREPCAG